MVATGAGRFFSAVHRWVEKGRGGWPLARSAVRRVRPFVLIEQSATLSSTRPRSS